MASRSTAQSLAEPLAEARTPRDRASIALVCDVVDAVEALSERGLSPRVRDRLVAIVERADALGQGVPVSLAARLLAVSEPTVRTWADRGVLELVRDAKPRAVTPKSLGEALVAVGEIRRAGKDERLLRRILDVLDDQRTRTDLAERIDELDERQALDPSRVAEELFS